MSSAGGEGQGWHVAAKTLLVAAKEVDKEVDDHPHAGETDQIGVTTRESCVQPMVKRTAVLAFWSVLILSPATSFADVLVTISHEVKDFAAWKKVFDADNSNRKKAGLKTAYVGREGGRPNVARIVLIAKSPEKLQAFMSNPALNATMEKAGVLSAPDVHVAEIVK